MTTISGPEQGREPNACDPNARDKDPGMAGHTSPAEILVVEDDELARLALVNYLLQVGYSVRETGSVSGARAASAERPFDLILLDYRLPDGDGFELLGELKGLQPETPVILMTAHSTVERAVWAMKRGAFDFLRKPLSMDRVLAMVIEALDATRLQRNVRALRVQAGSLPLLGPSEQMDEVRRLIRKFARSPASTVLVTGESGVGKDLVARALHAESARARKSFLNITCSALPESLLESELFGHERGAFTDARSRKVGLFEQAAGGTVFLDEIGEMSPPLQAKLLRFLEEKAFRRVGGSGEIRPDVRIIAATHRDLWQAVRAGAFREDLWYRLAVLHIAVPPLRERREDVPALAEHFVERFNREFNKSVRGISARGLRALQADGWQGNVRELRNVVERAVLLSEAEVLEPEDFRGGMLRESQAPGTFRLPAAGVDLRSLERDLVAQALRRTEGNQTRAAELLGLNRDQIRYRIEKFRLGLAKNDSGDDESSGQCA